MCARMRTVQGRTDRVVVVGAGLGGLSAALHLCATGRQVTIIERENFPGGRCGLLTHGGYRVDTGPSVLTMPDVIAATFAAVGESSDDWLRLHRLDPAYRAQFADGSTIDVQADVDEMAENIAATCGPRDAAGYRRYVGWLARLYRVEFDRFIDRNLDSIRDLGVGPIAQLVAMGGLRRWGPKVGTYLRDERLQRIFSFQSLYAGVAPAQALALYAVISYLDTVQGVYFPEGGMHALPRALAEVATAHGVAIRYGTRAVRIEVSGDRANAVHTDTGERIPCDVVVVNADLPAARRDLLEGYPRARSRRPTRYSPSCVLVHLGSPTATTPLPVPPAHHVISFGAAWRQTFTELEHGDLVSDPSFLISTPTVTDPSIAAEGHDLHQVLFPVPNLDHRAPLDWRSGAPAYLEHIRTTLRARGFGDAIDRAEVISVRTPEDWRASGFEYGTPFAAAHTFAQTGPLRTSTLDPAITNLVLCGCGVQPGIGIPMVLLSGRLAALRVTSGQDRPVRGALRR
jgi:phytoene desaturase